MKTLSDHLYSKKIDERILGYMRREKKSHTNCGLQAIINFVVRRSSRKTPTEQYVIHRLDYLLRVGVIEISKGRYANETYYRLKGGNDVGSV